MALQCSNKKPDGSWCGVPIEWREMEGQYKPNGDLKKRPFEVDTGNMHNCPYWKKTFSKPTGNNKPKSTQEGIINEQLNNGVKIEKLEKDVREIKVQISELGKALAQISNFKASQLKKHEEPVDDEEVMED